MSERITRGLAGKVAIVTGAGSRAEGIGNGRAAAILLASEGARVLLLDANPAWAERTRAMILADGGEAPAVQGRCDQAGGLPGRNRGGEGAVGAR